MDTVTHTLLGAAIGEAILGKRIGRKAMFYGALTSNIPDIDVLGILKINEAVFMAFFFRNLAEIMACLLFSIP